MEVICIIKDHYKRNVTIWICKTQWLH
jgi:hypothetical protein